MEGPLLVTDTLPRRSIVSMVLVLALVVVTLFVASAIVCATNTTCLSRIPTVNNMLKSPIITPYVITALNTVGVIHLIVSLGLYSVTVEKAPHLSRLQLLFAALIYVAAGVTLFILPFTAGWDANWGNLAILVAVAIWMVAVQISTIRGKPFDPIPPGIWRWQVASMLLYDACAITYIVLRAVDLPYVNKSVGILVCEIVGGLAVTMFFLAIVLILRPTRLVFVTAKPDK